MPRQGTVALASANARHLESKDCFCLTSVHWQLWHKGCFSCEVCKLKLTMSTYRGYETLPYCRTYSHSR